ncbi:hypothetical protein [Piscirickettsia salmonis]|uniref:hypothetical protein n=1 Tax=Piscirickettsia salmonis TaxID=1238 RepID=UPI0012B903F0|nr:hypothetical protein [Piscirickettsia salmonis]
MSTQAPTLLIEAVILCFFNSFRYFLLVYRKRRYLGRYFAHPMMQNRRAKRDDYKPSAVRVTQRCVP